MYSLKSACSLTVLAAAIGLSFSTPTVAQEYGYAYGAPPPTEEVIVTAPRSTFREQRDGGRGTLDLPPSKISLSQAVSYSDLNLARWDDALELRHRVRAAAHDVCRELAEAYPLHQISGSNCYRDAVRNGLVRANSAIASAQAYGWGYSYGYEEPYGYDN